MPNKVCIRCGAVFQGPGSRCPRHPYRRSSQPERSYTERKRRKAVVAAWVAEHGHICPGYGVPPHPSHQLQADHIQPTSLGGDVGGELAVLCRSCNVRKSGLNRVRFPSKRVQCGG